MEVVFVFGFDEVGRRVGLDFEWGWRRKRCSYFDGRCLNRAMGSAYWGKEMIQGFGFWLSLMIGRRRARLS